MKYLIWQNDNVCEDECVDDDDKILNILLTNRSFAEVFEGENPLYPVGEIIKMHQKKYRITKFEKMKDTMIEVKVDLVEEGVSQAA